MRCFILFVLTMMLVACATPSPVQELGTKYEVLKGTLAAPPGLDEGGKRLWLYLMVGSKVEGEDPQVIVCLATNNEKKRVLKETKDNILRVVEEPVFIYGTKQTEPFEEIVDGVDYYVSAVGFYVPEARKYRFVMTTYGTGLRDAMRDVSWGEFVKLIGKAGIKALKP